MSRPHGGAWLASVSGRANSSHCLPRRSLNVARFVGGWKTATIQAGLPATDARTHARPCARDFPRSARRLGPGVGVRCVLSTGVSFRAGRSCPTLQPASSPRIERYTRRAERNATSAPRDTVKRGRQQARTPREEGRGAASDVVGNGEKSEMDLDAEVKAGRGDP